MLTTAFCSPSLITSLSKLIHAPRTKKRNHCYHWWSLMCTFPFPPLPSPQWGKERVLFIPVLSDISHASPARWSCSQSWSQRPQTQRWRLGGTRGVSGCSSGLAESSQGAGFTSDSSPRSNPRLHIWADANADLDLSRLLKASSSYCALGRGGTGLSPRSRRQSPGLQKLGNQSKNRCFSKSLVFSSVLLPYSASR